MYNRKFFKKLIAKRDEFGRIFYLISPTIGTIHVPMDNEILLIGNGFDQGYGIFVVNNENLRILDHYEGDIFEIVPLKNSRVAIHEHGARLEKCKVKIPQHEINAGEFFFNKVRIKMNGVEYNGVFYSFDPIHFYSDNKTAGTLETPAVFKLGEESGFEFEVIPVISKIHGDDVVSGIFEIPFAKIENFPGNPSAIMIDYIVNHYGGKLIKNRNGEPIAIFDSINGYTNGDTLYSIPIYFDKRENSDIFESVSNSNIDVVKKDGIYFEGAFKIKENALKSIEDWSESDFIDYLIQTGEKIIGEYYLYRIFPKVNTVYYGVIASILRVYGDQVFENTVFELDLGTVYLRKKPNSIFEIEDLISKIEFDENYWR